MPATTPPHPERDLLLRLIAGPVSGDALARASGQTRAAVWKRIEALRRAGIAIEAQAGRGYALAQPLELLDATAILDALPDQARAGISDLEVRWTVGSTNVELLGAAPLPLVAVLLAERQTDGRGRRGRSWTSPMAASLALSVARGFEGGLARLGGLSLVAGIAVVEALRGLGVADVQLKWPNDVVVPDVGGLRKLGGILVEGGGEHGGPARAVVGIGINVAMPPRAAQDIDQPWTDLATLCGDDAPTRNAVAAALLAALLPAMERFDREGLVPFLPRFAACDALQGKPVAVHAQDGQRAGVAIGIAADGALQVRFADGVRAVHAGEVSVRGASAHG